MKTFTKFLIPMLSLGLVITSCNSTPNPEPEPIDIKELMAHSEAALATYETLDHYNPFVPEEDTSANSSNGVTSVLKSFSGAVATGFAKQAGKSLAKGVMGLFFPDKTQEKLDKIIDQLNDVQASLDEVNAKLDDIIGSLEDIASQISDLTKLVEGMRQEMILIAMKDDLEVLRNLNAEIVTFNIFTSNLPGLFATDDSATEEQLRNAYDAIHLSYSDIGKVFSNYASLLLTPGAQGSMDFFDTLEYIDEASNFIFDKQSIDFYNYTCSSFVVPFLQSAMVVSGYYNYIIDTTTVTAEKTAAEAWLKTCDNLLNQVEAKVENKVLRKAQNISFYDSEENIWIPLSHAVKTEKLYPSQCLVDKFGKPSGTNPTVISAHMECQFEPSYLVEAIFSDPDYYTLKGSYAIHLENRIHKIYEATHVEMNVAKFFKNVGFDWFYKQMDDNAVLADLSGHDLYIDKEQYHKTSFSATGITLEHCKSTDNTIIANYAEKYNNEWDQIYFESDVKFFVLLTTDSNRGIANNIRITDSGSTYWYQA